MKIKRIENQWHVYQEFCGASYQVNKNLLTALFRFCRDSIKYRTWRAWRNEQKLNKIYGKPKSPIHQKGQNKSCDRLEKQFQKVLERKKNVK